jgi:hypothetical protein
MVPGLKFSTSTSASAMSFLANSWPFASLKFKVTDFLLRAMMGHQSVRPAFR